MGPTQKEDRWFRKHLLDIESLSADEIRTILDTAEGFKEVSTRRVKKVPALRGTVVVNLFFEPSTRTKTSFNLAAKRLSADTVDLNIAFSSTKKGETLKDTARNIESMGIDIVVIRHRCAGAANLLANTVDASVINAGDGSHAGPASRPAYHRDIGRVARVPGRARSGTDRERRGVRA